MQKDTTTNISQTVRQVLQDIGAVSSNPPKGWKELAVQKLKELNVDVNKVNIYAIRSKELNKVKEEKSPIDIQDYGSVLLELRSLSNKVGGIDKLLEFVTILKELKN